MRSFLIIVIICLFVGCEKNNNEYPEVLVKFDISKNEDGFYAGEGFAVVNLSKNAAKITWDFGDGKISHDSICVHSYSKKGNYILTLIACNHGHCDSIKYGITVKDSLISLLTNNSSKKWTLTNWIDKNGYKVSFDSCSCLYSCVFHKTGEHFLLNTGKQVCGQDTFQCIYQNPSDHGWFEKEFDPFNRNNFIMIGKASKGGYTIVLDYNQLFLKSNLSGDKFYYKYE